MLKARPCALPRCADRPDPLATLDTVPDPNGDLGEVAIDRSEAVRIMVDDDDQTAQVAVVTRDGDAAAGRVRSEEHTSELQSRLHLVCRLLLEKKKKQKQSK